MKPTIIAPVLATALVLAAACGGSTRSSQVTPPGDDVLGDDYAGDAAGVDATSDASDAGDAAVDSTGDGGCISPTVGESCASGQTACQPQDPCCAGYVWVCTATGGAAGTWQQEGLGCACNVGTGDGGPFACGSHTCTGQQFCEVQPPGIAFADGGTPPTAYTCTTVPPACAASPTCACIESTIPPQDVCSTQTPGVSCNDDGAGHVTIDCLGE
ncbi:MAG: hypothetical protein ACRELB_10290 [Polyangiaceae bacterium]